MTDTVFVCHRHPHDPKKMGIFEYHVTQHIYESHLIAKIVKDYYNYLTQPEIAKNHQVEERHVKNFLLRNNLFKLPRRYELETELIIDKYVNQHMNIGELSEEYKCSRKTIAKLLKKNGINIRVGAESKKMEYRQEPNVKLIIDKYVNQRISSLQLGKEYNCSPTTILAILCENGIKIRTTGEAMRKYFANETFFDQIDIELKAYILGFLYADGYNNEEHGMIKINLSKQDLEILIKIRDALSPDSKIRDYLHPGHPGKEYINLSICCRHMSEALARHGCMQAKTFKVTFPTFLSKDLIQHFIRGYSDGDGCISRSYKAKRWIYYYNVAGTESLTNGIAEVFRTEVNAYCGMRQLNNDWTNNLKLLVVNGNRQVKECLDWMYKDATIFLQRKYDRYLDLCHQCEEMDLDRARRGLSPGRRRPRLTGPIIVPIPKIDNAPIVTDYTELKPIDEFMEDGDHITDPNNAIERDEEDLHYGNDRFDYENFELDEDELELDDDQLEDA